MLIFVFLGIGIERFYNSLPIILNLMMLKMKLNFTGTGTIEDFGKTINLTFTITSSVGSYNYTEKLTKK